MSAKHLQITSCVVFKEPSTTGGPSLSPHQHGASHCVLNPGEHGSAPVEMDATHFLETTCSHFRDGFDKGWPLPATGPSRRHNPDDTRSQRQHPYGASSRARWAEWDRWGDSTATLPPWGLRPTFASSRLRLAAGRTAKRRVNGQPCQSSPPAGPGNSSPSHQGWPILGGGVIIRGLWRVADGGCRAGPAPRRFHPRPCARGPCSC